MRLADINIEDLSLFVGLLTVEQKDQLIDQLYTSDSYFNPIQDADDNWVVSVEEIQNNTNPNTMWVKDIELIPYNPKINIAE